jgi:hypothetical protein
LWNVGVIKCCCLWRLGNWASMQTWLKTFWFPYCLILICFWTICLEEMEKRILWITLHLWIIINEYERVYEGGEEEMSRHVVLWKNDEKEGERVENVNIFGSFFLYYILYTFHLCIARKNQLVLMKKNWGLCKWLEVRGIKEIFCLTSKTCLLGDKQLMHSV